MTPNTTHQVRFTGDAKTYFGIWIVNILLSILTLGIYSAWAKVRTRRYFNQNTLIDGRRFDYHATGKQILIGRIAVVVFFILASLPVIGLFLLLGLLVALPWLMNRSIAFNARMTSFSGLRFGFDGSYGQAFLVFLLYPFLSALTLFLAYPFAIRAKHRYTLNRYRYGTARFGFDSPVGPFYVAILLAAAISLVIAGLIFFGLGGVGLVQQLFVDVSYGTDGGDAALFLVLLIYAAGFVAILPGAFIYQAFLRNAVYSCLTLEGGHRFASSVAPLRLVWIALSNAVVTIFTVGLMYPWAKVRMARYMAACTTMIVAGSLDDFVGRQESSVTAIGDAYADLEGVDLGLAI